MNAPVIVWFRKDLRLADNPALFKACQTGQPVVATYILEDQTQIDFPLGGASKWWLYHSLMSLSAALDGLGIPLILRRGNPRQILDALCQETGADTVHWNRMYDPYAQTRDTEIKAFLTNNGITVHSFNASLLVEPWHVATKTGTPYKIFTPFWRQARNVMSSTPPLPRPECPPAFQQSLQSDHLTDWSLRPHPSYWAAPLAAQWLLPSGAGIGEDAAQNRLDDFITCALPDYDTGRDRPDQKKTSQLSPHLHWGEISPRQIWSALELIDPLHDYSGQFRAELGWREFSTHLLYHFPQITTENLRREFDPFPWRDEPAALAAWQKGRTGIPIVDAGMRQLWDTGWMHNRVRMITASFLVKHLMIPWQQGAAWFWDTLVDADLASNSASWQWVAGSGCDASPYFRIFNPVLQGEKFDPLGDYVRRWVPELKNVPAKYIHKPWNMTQPPASYPAPIIELGVGRTRALEAYKNIQN
ncbi:cryptochrome/photolyase family protein [Paremcibacter congregatus]|uniref:Deoxyribodipyrimidine photo-lyase n=1 Tax=Paremcibacter congregatus TaxID=2043170 RepID=A0A2G4YUM7_9PROT|nr:deoxyribodipyrimidine photo-lyase [Paremcibacter congregatus]PHZ86025.1 deoxyribodipyrimidine photolyase [Paremcibacter congregatus]QDE26991.1 deoxyribodipyrimidine photo-lyase [Paremcibacter congregatus]